MRGRSFFFFWLVGGCRAQSTPPSPTTYSVTALPVPSNAIQTPTGINNNGDIVGEGNGQQFSSADGSSESWRILKGSFQVVPIIQTAPHGIDNQGDIAVEARAPLGALLWQANAITPLPNSQATSATVAGIDGEGDVVGNIPGPLIDNSYFAESPVLWHAGQFMGLGNGTLVQKHVVAQAVAERAVGSSISMIVVGNAAFPNAVFFWEDGTYFVLDASSLGSFGPGFFNSNAIAVNKNGWVVGNGCCSASGKYAANFSFVARIPYPAAVAPVENLGSLGLGYGTTAWAINNNNQIVGSSYTTDLKMHAFIWSSGEMTDLNTLIAAPGWELTQATGINDSGTIVGTGTFGGMTYPILLQPGQIPSITAQPASMTITSGTSVTLSVTAIGTAPLVYQWYQGTTPIVGATQSTFSTGVLTAPPSTYTYSVTVSNPDGSVTSSPATITLVPVCAAPSIAMQPQDQTVTSGNLVTANVVAGGTGLQYQWYRDSLAIAGATASTYTTGVLTNSTTLYVVVTGQCGSPVVSRIATITVTPACTPPLIVTQPSSQSVVSDTSATLSVVANGSALRYQWNQSGGVPIPGATHSTYTTLPITSAAYYSVTVSNSCGTQQSAIVLIESNILLGPPSSYNPTGTAAEPVNTATGNYYSSHVDMQVRARGLSFSFARSYNSGDSYSGPLGVGWTHTYNLFLSADSQTGVITIKQADGSLIYFAPTGSGSYTAVTIGLHDVLRKNSDGSFTLTRKNQVQLSFSSAGKLVEIIDRNGNSQTVVHDANGNLISVTDTVGRSFTFGNDSSGRLLSVTDPIGRLLQYSYDAAGNLATFRDAQGGLTQYTYDANHRLLSGTDAHNVVYVQNTFDSQGRVISQKNGNGQSTTFAYNTPVSGTTTITDPLGNATQHVYDGNLRILQIVNAQNGVTSFAYDTNNDRTSVTNANGKTTQFAYDGRGNVTSLTDPLGDTASFVYDAYNDILQTTNPAGKVTTFAYDGSHNLISIQDPLGDVTAFTYDGFGNVASRIDAVGNKTMLSYDPTGNLTKVLDQAGDTVAFGYDGIGRVVSATDGNGHAFAITYDALSRRTKTVDALGYQTQYTYDAVGNLLDIMDANGNPTAYQYDNVNNLVAVKDAMGNTTVYGYDGNSNRISFTNARGKTTTYEYDSLNRRTKVTDPLGLFSSYSYDPVGSVVSVADANGKTHNFVYDALNRTTTRAYADGNVISYTYDVNGNRTSMTDAHGTTSYAYDALNRVASVTSAGGGVVKYAYDGDGRRTLLTYPDGRAVSYLYDNGGRLSQVKDWLSRTTTYSYDAAGNRIATIMGNGVNSAYVFDNANRLLSVTNGSGGRMLSSYTYELDKVGNRTQVTDAATGITHYTYDVLNRLVTWIPPSGQASMYLYDPVGNRTSLISAAGTTSYTYDAADRLLTAGKISFTYDGNGNRLTKTTGTATVAYSFDSLNRLTAVFGGGVATQYQYDGNGNRIAQQAGTSAYQYSLDVVRSHTAVLNEAGPDGNIDYQYGLGVLSGSSASLEQFYQADGMGSTADVTDVSGSLKASYAYDPWGKLLNPIDPLGTKDKFKFGGEALDPETGLIFLRARYYDPTVGRFISKDPFPGFAAAPRTTNRYSYVLDNPVNLVDSSGLASEPPSSDVISVPSASTSRFLSSIGGGGFLMTTPSLNMNPLQSSDSSSDFNDQPQQFSPVGVAIVDTAIFIAGVAYPPFGLASGIATFGLDIWKNDINAGAIDGLSLIPGSVGTGIGLAALIYNDYPVTSDPTIYGNPITSVNFSPAAQSAQSSDFDVNFSNYQ